jgi:hypothetical protein
MVKTIAIDSRVGSAIKETAGCFTLSLLFPNLKGLVVFSQLTNR